MLTSVYQISESGVTVIDPEGTNWLFITPKELLKEDTSFICSDSFEDLLFAVFGCMPQRWSKYILMHHRYISHE